MVSMSELVQHMITTKEPELLISELRDHYADTSSLAKDLYQESLANNHGKVLSKSFYSWLSIQR